MRMRPGSALDASADADRAARLYSAHIDDALRFAFLLTGNTARAQDHSQDAFLRCISRFESLSDESAFGAYLRKAVYREVLMEARTRSRERLRQLAWAREQRPVDELLTAESRTDLIAIVRTLPLKQRVTVLLRFWADLPEKEIAEAMTCSTGTVKSNLSRALTKIRRAYSNEES